MAYASVSSNSFTVTAILCAICPAPIIPILYFFIMLALGSGAKIRFFGKIFLLLPRILNIVLNELHTDRN